MFHPEPAKALKIKQDALVEPIAPPHLDGRSWLYVLEDVISVGN